MNENKMPMALAEKFYNAILAPEDRPYIVTDEATLYDKELFIAFTI